MTLEEMYLIRKNKGLRGLMYAAEEKNWAERLGPVLHVCAHYWMMGTVCTEDKQAILKANTLLV